MGNQNSTPKPSTKQRISTTERIEDRTEQPHDIDLDEIIEQWIWHMWNRTKTKSLSHYKREELLVTINWKRVVFSQSDARFSGLPPVRLPQSQTLFRTNFDNKTTQEQSYAFKTERFTRSTFKFTFKNRLTKSEESTVIFRLPDEIVQIGGGIKREQSVECGRDTVKEYNMRWSVNSQIRVPPRSCLHAELTIDEEEMDKDFSVSIRFFGRISARIATRQSPNTYLKFMEGDIVQILRETMENHPRRCAGLEIVEENPPIVQFTMRGKCSFRYGVEQHVAVNQTSLDPLFTCFVSQNNNNNTNRSSPFEYRPLRSHLISSNSDIQLHIENED